MNNRSNRAIGAWRTRNARTSGDRAYLAYVIVMVGFVTVVPIVRAVWAGATSAAGVAAFTSPAAPGVTALVVAALWAGALLWGRDRGPALRPPFLTYALAASDLPRSETFLDPVLRAGVLVVAVTASAAGLVAGSLVGHGLVDPLNGALFIVTGALVGIITTVAWLAGQVVARAALPIALGVLVLGAVAAVVPVTQSFTPWGWVGVAYPRSGSSFPGLVTLTAFTAALAAVVPALLNRLGLAELSAQSARWESAVVRTVGMEFGEAIAVYQRRPQIGRHVRAIRSVHRLPLMFLIRDAIGATRAPGRLIVGALALVSAGVLVTLTFAPAAPTWPLGAFAGLLVFAGLGPFTDGIRHAASVAADLPLYGVSDESLLASHALFPLMASVVLLLAAVIVCSTIGGIGAAAPMGSSLILGLLALIVRAASALKGSLPVALLIPIPTLVGDLGAAVRMAWALDAVLFAALAGAAAALAFSSPILLIGVSTALLGVGIRRWRHRT